MDNSSAAAQLKYALEQGSIEEIEEALFNLEDGTCDAVELIPLLEQVALKNYFYSFDDNGAGGFPHPVGNGVPFGSAARRAIANIRENRGLGSDSAIARALKSLDTDTVKSALEHLATGGCEDETLIPILEKIAYKDQYDLPAGFGRGRASVRLGNAAWRAIQRIRQSMGAFACPLCATIPYTSTGHDEDFGPPITSLKRHELDCGQDLRECPECGTLFHWHQETLRRIPSTHAAVLRRIVHRAGAAIDDPTALAGGLLKLPLRGIAGIHLMKRDRELARELVPALIEAAAEGDAWSAWFLKNFASTPEEARFVLRVLDARPPASASLPDLRDHARTLGCSICAPIGSDRPANARRDALPPNLAMLKQLGASERNDVWECPECDSLFHWQSDNGIAGGLTRVTGVFADALRKCLRRTVTDEDAIEMVFTCGREWQQLLFEHGMRHDPQLVLHLVPHMVSLLARNQQQWLHDALCEVAQDPYGAAAVRAAAAKIERGRNSLIKSLAARL